MIETNTLSFEEIIDRHRANLLAQREVVVLKEKEFENGSTMQFCYNSEASNLLQLAGQLQWVLKVYKDCEDAKLFPNCLDYIEPESNYEAGEHGV